jgi:hypothetical protein
MQGPHPQGFDGLRVDLIIGHLWGLDFELQEPSVKKSNVSFSL